MGKLTDDQNGSESVPGHGDQELPNRGTNAQVYLMACQITLCNASTEKVFEKNGMMDRSCDSSKLSNLS